MLKWHVLRTIFYYGIIHPIILHLSIYAFNVGARVLTHVHTYTHSHAILKKLYLKRAVFPDSFFYTVCYPLSSMLNRLNQMRMNRKESMEYFLPLKSTYAWNQCSCENCIKLFHILCMNKSFCFLTMLPIA